MISSHHRRVFATATAVTMLLAGTGTAAAAPTDSTAQVRTSSQGPADSARVAPKAAGRGDLRPAGRLRWKPCPDQSGLECAHLVVPQNWDQPSKRNFVLAVSRLPATGKRVIGTVFVNPGGPGASGTQFLPAFKDNTALRRRFNIVSWDPRGVATTTPGLHNCQVPTGSMGRLNTGPYSWRNVAGTRAADEAASNRKCLAANRRLARYVGTNDVVRDLDALRAAVGDKRLTYLGYSYGTSIGRSYALTFPTKVRAMILDGATAPQAVMDTYLLNQGKAAVTSWPMIRATFPAGIGGVYDRLDAHLQTHTIDAGSLRFSRWDYWSMAINAGRSPETLNALPTTICALATLAGMTEPACVSRTATRSQTRSRLNQVRDLIVGSPALRLINCGDMSGRPTSNQIAASLTRFDAARGPEAAMNVLNFASVCSGMPAAWNQIPQLSVRSRVNLPAPPLIINARGDVATPYVGAKAVHRALVGSRLITVRSTFHGFFGLRNSSCVDDAALGYLVSAILPKQDSTCPQPR